MSTNIHFGETNMRTQPQEVIAKLEADNSRLAKEKILLEAMNEGLDEFFEGLRMCLDKLYTFGVKQVPTKDDVISAQGCKWEVFKELAEKLNKRFALRCFRKNCEQCSKKEQVWQVHGARVYLPTCPRFSKP